MSAAEVDAYIDGLGDVRRERVAAVVAMARAIPGIAESMDWGMPVFRRNGRFFAAKSQKAYVSLYLDIRQDLAAQVVASDPGLKHGKACVNVTDRRPMPLAALRSALDELFG